MRHDVTITVQLPDGSPFVLTARNVDDPVVDVMRAALEGIRADGYTVTGSIAPRPDPTTL